MKAFEEFTHIQYEINSSLDTGILDIEVPQFKPMRKFISNEPHDYINEFYIKFKGVDEDESEYYIGEMHATHFKLNEALSRNDVTLFDIFDCHDQETHELYCAIMDINEDYFKEDIDIGLNNDIFFIYELNIDPLYSGNDVPEIILRNVPNILRYNRDIWVGAIIFKTCDADMRRTLVESGFLIIPGTEYLFINPEDAGYYISIDDDIDAELSDLLDELEEDDI